MDKIYYSESDLLAAWQGAKSKDYRLVSDVLNYSDWSGLESQEEEEKHKEILDFLKYGNEKYAKLTVDALNILENQTDDEISNDFYFDCKDGFAFDVQAVVNGLPETDICECESDDNRKICKLVIDCSYSHKIEVQPLLNRAAAIVNIIERLKSQNIIVEIEIAANVKISNSQKTYYLRHVTNIDTINVSKIASYSHPLYLRAFLISFVAKIHKKNITGSKMGSLKLSKNDVNGLKETLIDFNENDFNAKYATPKKALQSMLSTTKFTVNVL